MLSSLDLLNLGLGPDSDDPKNPVSLSRASGPAPSHPKSKLEVDQASADSAEKAYGDRIHRGGKLPDGTDGGEFSDSEMASAVHDGDALQKLVSALKASQDIHAKALEALSHAGAPADATAVRIPSGAK